MQKKDFLSEMNHIDKENTIDIIKRIKLLIERIKSLVESKNLKKDIKVTVVYLKELTKIDKIIDKNFSLQFLYQIGIAIIDAHNKLVRKPRIFILLDNSNQLVPLITLVIKACIIKIKFDIDKNMQEKNLIDRNSFNSLLLEQVYKNSNRLPLMAMLKLKGDTIEDLIAAHRLECIDISHQKGLDSNFKAEVYEKENSTAMSKGSIGGSMLG